MSEQMKYPMPSWAVRQVVQGATNERAREVPEVRGYRA